LEGVWDKMSNETLSTQSIGTPAAKLGEWISAEEQYMDIAEQIPRDVENIIWKMMVLKAPLMDAFEMGVRVLHVPAEEKPRIVNVEEDTDLQTYKDLVGGSFEGWWLFGNYYMYCLDYAMTQPINRFIFKNLGLIIRGNVVIVRNDEDGGKIDYLPIDWKQMEINLIKRGLLFHYIYKCRNPTILEELHLNGMIDRQRKRI